MTTPQNEADVIDVGAKDNAPAEEKKEDWTSRAPWTAAVAKQLDSARALIQEQLKTGPVQFGEVEKKAKDLVEALQSGVDKVGDRVREEGKGAVGRFEAFRERFGKWPVNIDLESWINLPVEAREEVLSALGIASDRQVGELKVAIDTLGADLKAAIEAQTDAIQAQLNKKARAAARKPKAAKRATKGAAAKA